MQDVQSLFSFPLKNCGVMMHKNTDIVFTTHTLLPELTQTGVCLLAQSVPYILS